MERQNTGHIFLAWKLENENNSKNKNKSKTKEVIHGGALSAPLTGSAAFVFVIVFIFVLILSLPYCLRAKQILAGTI